MLRVLLVFGVAFEIPLFVVLLNLAGVVRANTWHAGGRWIIFGTFVFAAVATPSTDPITMLLLAIPMTMLFLISEMIARVVDRRRGTSEPDYETCPTTSTRRCEPAGRGRKSGSRWQTFDAVRPA